MSWAVVRFLKDNSVENVPENWLSHDKKCCYWPPETVEIKKAIKKCMLVNKKTWSLCTIQMMSKKLFHNYSTASAKATKACNTSDISDVDRKTYSKRVPIKKKMEDFVSSHGQSDEEQQDDTNESASESLSDEEDEESSPDKRQKIDSNNSNNGSVGENSSNHIAGSSDGNIGQQSLGSTLTTSFISTPRHDRNTTPRPQHNNTNPRQSGSSSNEVLAQLILIKNLVKENGRKLEVNTIVLNTILEKWDETKETVTQKQNLDNCEEALLMFPIGDEEGLSNFDNKIVDQNTFELVSKQLSRVGGTGFKDLTRRILQKMFTDELLATYSYQGHKKKKKFATKKAASVIIDAVTLKFPGVTNKEVELTIAVYFSKATERLKKAEQTQLETA